MKEWINECVNGWVNKWMKEEIYEERKGQAQESLSTIVRLLNVVIMSGNELQEKILKVLNICTLKC